MREIKFRCWSDNKMYEIDSIDFWDETVSLTGAGYINMENAKLMQYTGLKDKNGKEIYEGDILEWTTFSGKKYRFSVEYSNEYAQYTIANTGDISMENEPLGDFENIEVIGNTYDLLKEK